MTVGGEQVFALRVVTAVERSTVLLAGVKMNA